MMRCWGRVKLQGQNAQRTAGDGTKYTKADIQCSADLFGVFHLAAQHVTVLCERRVAQYDKVSAVRLVLACLTGLALLSKLKRIQWMTV